MSEGFRNITRVVKTASAWAFIAGLTIGAGGVGLAVWVMTHLDRR